MSTRQTTKKKKLITAIALATTVGLTGCIDEGDDGSNSLASIVDLPPGELCTNGGKQIQTGLDSNNNDILDADEITQTTEVCNGETGDTGEDGVTGFNSLIAMNNVAADDLSCEFGGLLIRSGLDLNRNSILDTDEIENNQYLCNQDEGSSIAAIIASLTASPTTVETEETTTLTVTPTSSEDTIFSYVWRNNDGDVIDSSSNSVDVTEAVAGTYQYTVELTNVDGIVQSRSVNIFVTEQLEAVQVSSVSTSTRQVFLPQGFDVASSSPSGDFDGSIVTVSPETVSSASFRSLRSTASQIDVAGFIAERPAFSAGTDSASVMTSLSNTVATESDISLSNVSTSSPNLNDDVTSAVYRLSLSNALTPTELNNRLIILLGANQLGGIIQDLPAPLSGDVPASEYQLNMSVTYFNNSDMLLTATVVAIDNLESYSTQVSGLNDGTNVAESGASIDVTSDSYNAQAETSALADFLFVIDNSGSMSDEQNAISQAATDFSTVMSASGLDFQIGTITTDNASLRGNGFTSDLAQFQIDVVAGTYGSGIETGIYYSENALLSTAEGDASDGTVTTAGYPRPGATLSVVLLSDEPSQYTSNSATAFDVSNNLFVDRGIRFYSIVEQNYPGQYIELSTSTFGSHASISDLSAFPAIMSTIATNAGAASSIYELNHQPISSTIRVLVDGVDVAKDSSNGWEYNSTSNRILFSGTAIPSEGAEVEIIYDYYLSE